MLNFIRNKSRYLYKSRLIFIFGVQFVIEKMKVFEFKK